MIYFWELLVWEILELEFNEWVIYEMINRNILSDLILAWNLIKAWSIFQSQKGMEVEKSFQTQSLNNVSYI